MYRRITDNPPSKMMMINTIFFGVGVGMVGLLWISYGQGLLAENAVEAALIDKNEKLFISTVAILFAGLFHSVLILHPKYRKDTADLAQSKLETEGLRDLAMRDPLTAIHNRRFFENSLNAYVEVFPSTRQAFGVMMIDLDHFKKVNDAHGHDAGDYVLLEVSKTLKQISRSYDVVARIGGEEFAVIAPLANNAELSSIAERFRISIGNTIIEYDGLQIPVSASIGTVDYIEGLDGKGMMQLADDMLYKAKAAGRNQVMSFTQ